MVGAQGLRPKEQNVGVIHELLLRQNTFIAEMNP
jgi:hypothetical protein